MNSGSCLCKAITFEISKFEPLAGHCHCKMCQKFHGAAFSTFGEVKRENFRCLTGKTLISTYTAENKTVRSFCKICGSSLFFESTFNRKDNTIEVALASFDHLIDITPDAHIYTESKAKWHEITDNLPQHAAYRVK
jgi:hypothetical protein